MAEEGNEQKNGKKELLSKIDDLLKDESPEVRTHVLQVISEVRTMYSGPLPRPEDLERYERIHPGLADRIMTMAEQQQKHRHECESEIIHKNLGISVKGQFIGAFIALVCIAAAVYLSISGHDTVAGIIGGATLIGAIIVFVLNKEPHQQQ